MKISLTVPELKTTLDAYGISYTSKHLRPDLIALLPDPDEYAELCQGARTAVIGQIKSERIQAMHDRIAAANAEGRLLEMSREEDILLTRDEALAAQKEKQFGYNIPVQFGKQLEPFARAYYQERTGFEVTEVGFIEAASGGFGCSPDGLVALAMEKGNAIPPWNHGVEIKCPIPETHIGWLLDQKLPDEHKFQVHACMAVTGLDRWDFLSYCPGEAPLLVEVYRDDFTVQLEQGLKTLVIEKAKMKRELDQRWQAIFGGKVVA